MIDLFKKTEQTKISYPSSAEQFSTLETTKTNAKEKEKNEQSHSGAEFNQNSAKGKKEESKINELLKRRKKSKISSHLGHTGDEVTKKIEKIMEDGVGDAFNRLSPIAKQEFKIKGEATAHKIRDLVRGGHVKVKKIFQLILEWLRLLPGINRFFLEQEAKIKTDRIVALHQSQRK